MASSTSRPCRKRHSPDQQSSAGGFGRYATGAAGDGVKLDDGAIGIGNLDVPAKVPLGRGGVMYSEPVETSTPAVEVFESADAERDRTETVQFACDGGRVVQTEGWATPLANDDADDGFSSS